jgi:hypothetical protein
MSQVNTNIVCPLCGQTVDLGVSGNHNLDCRTNESAFCCGNSECGFSDFTEIEKDKNGRRYWVETIWYPITDEGVVRRPTKKQIR